jgi:putative membrane protein
MSGLPSWGDPSQWPLEPGVLLGVAVAAILFLAGSGRQVPHRRDASVRTWREVAFWAGLASLLLALNSPLEYLARQLFWAHMVQHLVLITVSAPLLALAAPALPMWRGLPRALRRPFARVAVRHPALSPVRALVRQLGRPLPAWVLATANLWLWHWTPLYDLTLRNHLVHHLEHALFLGTGALLWMQVIDQSPFKGSLSRVQRTAYLFATTIQSWVLAGVLAFSPFAFYAYAQLPARPGGLTALGDQQVGAGMMWVPGSVSYSIAIIALLLLWLRDEERTAAAATEARGLGCSPS